MSFKMGSPYARDSSIPPNNTGIGGAAQKRINNVVARYNQSHKNALQVDGNPIYLWMRQPPGQGGVFCTCQQKHTPKSIEPNTPGINSPKQFDDLSEISQDDSDAMSGGYTMIHVRGGTQNQTDSLSEEVKKKFNLTTDVLPETRGDQFEGNSAPDGIQTTGYNRQQIAQFMDDSFGGGLFGGDSTACPICYSTGRINGYQIHNGGRILFESSGYWPFSLKNVEILPDRYPTAFRVFPGGYVSWTVDIPTNVYRWCTMGIFNKLEPMDALYLEVYWNDDWIPLDEAWLSGTNGIDRSDTQIRVIADPTVDRDTTYEFTHAELRYMQADPIPAQCANLDFPLDYEFGDVLISTSFEVSAEANFLPRESYFQDSKYGFIWKVNSANPHLTSNGQIFGYDVQVRRITKAEMFYSMAMIKPKDIANWSGFNGLQYMQGVFDYNKYPGTDKKAWNVAENEYQFPMNLDDHYQQNKEPYKDGTPPSKVNLINTEELPDFE